MKTATPLVWLPVELAQQAWLDALSWNPDGHVPARLVKRAVKTLLLGKDEREVLIANVQEIQRLLEQILSPKKTKA